MRRQALDFGRSNESRPCVEQPYMYCTAKYRRLSILRIINITPLAMCDRLLREIDYFGRLARLRRGRSPSSVKSTHVRNSCSCAGRTRYAVLASFARCARHVRVLELAAGIARGARERRSTPAKTHDDDRPLLPRAPSDRRGTPSCSWSTMAISLANRR